MLPVPKRKDYAPAVRQFNEWLAGRPINEETVKEFFAERRTRYKTRSVTLHKVAIKASLLKAFPSHDARVRASFDALFREIKLPKLEKRIHSSFVFSKSEIRKFIKAAPRHVGLFAQVLYDTGARVSEGLSIRLADCKQDRGAVLCSITGKGGKEGILTIEKKLFDRVRKVFAGKVWLFENTETGKAYTRKWASKELSRVSKKTLGRNMHPHTLRHSRVTHLLESGVPLDAVSRFARHAQTSTTLAFYAHTQMTSAAIIKSGL